jgi:cyclopropane fatty-acyl-phospholipid synthase-like methyltransferase
LININSKEYWEKRFSSGDWESKGGSDQTTQFAHSQLKHINLAKTFSGTILDFGCGLGDAIPLYKEKYPLAKLIGVDISESAISSCTQKYGGIASFIVGDHKSIPANVDVIIASNVFEHLSDDEEVAVSLKSCCKILYIIVPYKENLAVGCKEHVNRYTRDSFSSLKPHSIKVFASKGWSEYGFNLLYNVYIKNLLRPFFGKNIAKRNLQVMFQFLS